MTSIQRLLFSGLLLVLLSACVSTGTSTGGSAPAPPSNDALAAAVRSALARDTQLSSADIQVSADRGRVTLSGQVASSQDFLRAQSIARRVDGVRPPVVVVDLTYPRS